MDEDQKRMVKEVDEDGGSKCRKQRGEALEAFSPYVLADCGWEGCHEVPERFLAIL